MVFSSDRLLKVKCTGQEIEAAAASLPLGLPLCM